MSDEPNFILDTLKYGTLKHANTLVYYDYPRLFVCQDENQNYYIFNEWEDEQEYTTWGICDLKKYNIDSTPFLIENVENNHLYDDLIYDYTINFNYKTNQITEKEVQPRKWVDGKFIHIE